MFVYSRQEFTSRKPLCLGYSLFFRASLKRNPQFRASLGAQEKPNRALRAQQCFRDALPSRDMFTLEGRIESGLTGP